MHEVTIELEFKGHLAQKSGVTAEKLKISSDLPGGQQRIKDHMKDTYGIIPPYIMLRDGQSLAALVKKPGAVFSQDDRITVMGVISGG